MTSSSMVLSAQFNNFSHFVASNAIKPTPPFRNGYLTSRLSNLKWCATTPMHNALPHNLAIFIFICPNETFPNLKVLNGNYSAFKQITKPVQRHFQMYFREFMYLYF